MFFLFLTSVGHFSQYESSGFLNVFPTRLRPASCYGRNILRTQKYIIEICRKSVLNNLTGTDLHNTSFPVSTIGRSDDLPVMPYPAQLRGEWQPISKAMRREHFLAGIGYKTAA
jgi:hypothetical protein